MNIEEIFAKNVKVGPRLSKEDYAQQQKQLREELFEIANHGFKDIVSNPQKYLHYLEVQSNTSLTPTNVMIGMNRFENFQDAHEMEKWKRMGKTYVRKGEKAFYILKGDNRGDYTFYNPIKVFEESQLSVCPKKGNPSLAFEDKVNALTYKSRVGVEFVESSDQPVIYDSVRRMIIIAKDSDREQLLQGLIKSYCEEGFSYHYSGDSESLRFLSESAAFMVCKRMDVPSDSSFAQRVVENYKDFDAAGIRKDMEAVSDIYKEIEKRMDTVLYIKSKNKELEPQR